MKKTILLFLFPVLFPALMLFPQQNRVTGSVADSSSGKPLPGANILLLSLPDSSLRGTTSANNGSFAFNSLPSGKYAYTISYVGYKSFRGEFTLKTAPLKLGTLFLSPEAVKTDEVEVTGYVPPVITKGDTTEYNAGSFKTLPDASALDLVKKLPGVTVSDGDVKSRGEQIKEVLVDGRQLLSENPQNTLRKMPSEMIDKVQIYDKKSEGSEFSGIDDGELSRTMNLITKRKYKESTIGKFSGGYGSDNRYFLETEATIFKDYRRVGASGGINNINRGVFLPEDVDGRTFMMPLSGVTQSGFLNLFYSDNWGEDLAINSAYGFEASDNSIQKTIEREYINPLLEGQTNSETSNNNNEDKSHNFNLRMSLNIDSTSMLVLVPRFRFSENESSSGRSGISTLDNSFLNSVSSFSSSRFSAFSGGSSLMYKKMILKPGRIFSLLGDIRYSDKSGDDSFFSENILGQNNSDTINQSGTNNSNSLNYTLNAGFNEPLSSSSSLSVQASYSLSESCPDRRKFNITGGNQLLLDSSLSDNSESIRRTGYLQLGYKFTNTLYNFTLGFLFGRTDLEYDQILPYLSKVEKKFPLVQPRLSFSYNFSRDVFFVLDYHLMNNQPRGDQLQATVDNSNPVFLKTGNSELGQDMQHALMLRFNSYNSESRSSFRLSVTGTYTRDIIGTFRIFAESDTTLFRNIFLKKGSYLSYPVNLDKSYYLGAFINYSLPVDFLKSNFGLELSSKYGDSPVMVNSLLSSAVNNTYSSEFFLSSNIDNMDFSVSTTGTFNRQISNGGTGSRDYYTQNTRAEFKALIFERLLINCDLRHRYGSNLPAAYDKNTLIINAGVGVKLFSDKAGELRFSIYDLLEANKNITRRTDEILIEDQRSNSLGRYIILSFTYNLRHFPGK
ncbi:MAG: carboxypeptidase regulatory-like domain-containing protein [Ignavibacteriaceae bacterium]